MTERPKLTPMVTTPLEKDFLKISSKQTLFDGILGSKEQLHNKEEDRKMAEIAYQLGIRRKEKPDYSFDEDDSEDGENGRLGFLKKEINENPEYEMFKFATLGAEDLGLYKEFMALYKKNPVLYYGKAKESSYFNHFSLLSEPMEKELKIKQVLGVILEGEVQEDVKKAILRILKRRFPDTYDYFKNPTAKTYKKDFAQRYISIKSGLVKGTGTVYFSMLIYLYRNLTLKLDPKTSYREELDDCTRSHILLLGRDSEILESSSISKELSLRNSIILSDLEEEFVQCLSTFADLMNLMLIVIPFMEDPSYDPTMIDVSARELNPDLCNFVFNVWKDGTLDDLGILRNWVFCIREKLILEDLNFEVFFANENITDKEKDNLVDITLYMGTMDGEIFFDPTLYVSNFVSLLILKKYKKARTATITPALSEARQELNLVAVENARLQTALSEAKKEALAYRQEKERLELAQKSVNKKEDKVELVKDLQYQKEINRLKAELEKRKTSDTELAKLRTAIFDLTSDTNQDEQPPIRGLNELCEGRTIAFIGGHNILRTKLGAKFPKLKLIDGTLKTQNLLFLQSIDIAFIYSGYMNHGFYEKLMSTNQKFAVPFDYITHTNIDQIEAEICRKIEALLKKK